MTFGRNDPCEDRLRLDGPAPNVTDASDCDVQRRGAARSVDRATQRGVGSPRDGLLGRRTNTRMGVGRPRDGLVGRRSIARMGVGRPR